MEVAVCELESLAETKGLDEILSLAAKHKICVNRFPMSELRRRCSRLELLAVYQQSEDFFRQFRNTHPRTIDYKRKNDEDVLTATLRAFNLSASQVGQFEHDVFQFYRGIRNLITHEPSADQSKVHQRDQATLRGLVANSPYSKLEAPNLINHISFDDFLLFTRTLKQLAANMCEETIPTDEELVAAITNNNMIIKKLRALGENSDRRHRVVAGFLHERYSIPLSRAERIFQLIH
jgi:hypothetical protein